MKILPMNKYLPNNKQEISLFEAYFSIALQNKKGKLSKDVLKIISEFLDNKEFNKKNIEEFLWEIKKADSRLFNNYSRAFSRNDRVVQIKKPIDRDEVKLVSTLIPLSLHKKLKAYTKKNKTTISEELKLMIDKKMSSL